MECTYVCLNVNHSQNLEQYRDGNSHLVFNFSMFILKRKGGSYLDCLEIINFSSGLDKQTSEFL